VKARVDAFMETLGLKRDFIKQDKKLEEALV
jgi:hypothetical protein